MWKLTMSRKEITRLEAMALLKGNKNTQKEVAKLLGLSSRQTKRLWKEYKRHGASRFSTSENFLKKIIYIKWIGKMRHYKLGLQLNFLGHFIFKAR